jgi:hypothetical protein
MTNFNRKMLVIDSKPRLWYPKRKPSRPSIIPPKRSPSDLLANQFRSKLLSYAKPSQRVIPHITYFRDDRNEKAVKNSSKQSARGQLAGYGINVYVDVVVRCCTCSLGSKGCVRSSSEFRALRLYFAPVAAVPKWHVFGGFQCV